MLSFDECVIRVRERADFKIKLGSPKSESGHRDVPLGPFAANTLKVWKLACPRMEQNIVFPNEKRAHSFEQQHS
jgi:hypothetical protein